jgi:hypothetical protein
MYFSKEAIIDLEKRRSEIAGKYQKLVEGYMSLPLKNARAREFATQGLPRRVKIMQLCIESVFIYLKPEEDKIPQFDILLEVTMNLQAFVSNTFGSLDNIASIWVFEKDVKGGDRKPIPRKWVGLGPENTQVRKSLSADFQQYLATLDEWFRVLQDFRHALAHRIPLYIPPYVVSEEKFAEYKQLDAKKYTTASPDEYQRLTMEQMKLAKFAPWMQHSYEEGSKRIVFHPQVLRDFCTVEEVALKMLNELKR